MIRASFLISIYYAKYNLQEQYKKEDKDFYGQTVKVNIKNKRKS